MLPKELEKRLIAMHVKRGVDTLEEQATGQAEGIDKQIKFDILALGESLGLSPEETRDKYANFNTLMAEGMRSMIAANETYMVDDGVNQASAWLRNQHGIKLSTSDKKSLALKFLNNEKLLHEAESAMRRGEWFLMTRLKEDTERVLAHPLIMNKIRREEFKTTRTHYPFG